MASAPASRCAVTAQRAQEAARFFHTAKRGRARLGATGGTRIAAAWKLAAVALPDADLSVA